MPVPRLFEAFSEPREQWVHVLSTLLQLGGPETRAALVAELLGDPIEGTDQMLVSERRVVGKGPDAVTLDITLRRGEDWVIGVIADFCFDVDRAAAIAAARGALGSAARTVLVVITPDRRLPGDVAAAAETGEVIHKSWLRVRDWVQERPERGAATGVDLALLREAEYFYTPRVAELYRLEELQPQVAPELRGALASIFLALNDLAPAPTIVLPTDATAEVRYPRTGDVKVIITTGGPAPVVAVDGAAEVTIDSEAALTAARSQVLADARKVLPARK
jgi:hypothetical protein